MQNNTILLYSYCLIESRVQPFTTGIVLVPVDVEDSFAHLDLFLQQDGILRGDLQQEHVGGIRHKQLQKILQASPVKMTTNLLRIIVRKSDKTYKYKINLSASIAT
jgi:hypothetical protein